jgi:hypothetical protein
LSHPVIASIVVGINTLEQPAAVLDALNEGPVDEAILKTAQELSISESIGWEFENGQEGLDYYRLLPYRSGN